MEKIKQLRNAFDGLFSREIFESSYIEILDREDLILAANEEGYLYLIDKIISLCETQSEFEHYHFDEAGMVDKCEKNLLMKYKNSTW